MSVLCVKQCEQNLNYYHFARARFARKTSHSRFIFEGEPLIRSPHCPDNKTDRSGPGVMFMTRSQAFRRSPWGTLTVLIDF